MNNVDKIRNILIALGVPEKQQNELCEKFTQIASGKTRKMNGSVFTI